MNNPPLKINENLILEDNNYICNDLRCAAKYVNSFHVHFTLTTNINIKLKNELIADIFAPTFKYAKEMTVFFDNSEINMEGFKHNWSFKKDSMKAKDLKSCEDDFSKLWFNTKTVTILDIDDFDSHIFFSKCNDPSVLINPRACYGKNVWRYARYRADKYNYIAIVTDYHNVSNQSNAALIRPHITIVAKGDNLLRLLNDSFKYCKITNHLPVEKNNLIYLRVGRIKFNQAHLKKQGNDLCDEFGDFVEKSLREALALKNLLISLYSMTTYIEFDYRPETWNEYLSVIKTELKKMNVPKSTTIVSNTYPFETVEYQVYN